MKWEMKLSEIEGRALYAKEPFRQGETILTLPSLIKDSPDQFSIQVGPDLHVDCFYSPAYAVNHSCEPNAFVKGFKILAWKCIEPGEMITIDYKRTESVITHPFVCFCGTKSCKGRIE